MRHSVSGESCGTTLRRDERQGGPAPLAARGRENLATEVQSTPWTSAVRTSWESSVSITVPPSGSLRNGLDQMQQPEPGQVPQDRVARLDSPALTHDPLQGAP